MKPFKWYCATALSRAEEIFISSVGIALIQAVGQQDLRGFNRPDQFPDTDIELLWFAIIIDFGEI